jgi:hypothetical protein
VLTGDLAAGVGVVKVHGSSLEAPARLRRSARRLAGTGPRPAPDWRWMCSSRAYLLSPTFASRSGNLPLALRPSLPRRDRRSGGAIAFENALEKRALIQPVVFSAYELPTLDHLLSCWLQERRRRPDGSPSHEAAISLVS